MWWWWFILAVGIVFLLIIIDSIFKPFQKRVSFKGKNVFITGGSTGIGAELAKVIAKEKPNSITLLARTQKDLDIVANLINEFCPNVMTISCDVTNKEAMAQAIDDSVAKFGSIDFLITCAGLSTPGYFLEQELNVTEYTMQVDFFGTLYATHRAAHHMAKNKSGHIIMISSTLANLGIVGFSSYCPAKFAVKGLAEVLRSELAPYNIRISLVYPPDTNTSGYARENLTKPPDCKEICAMSTLFSPTDVAKGVLEGLKQGNYHVGIDFFTKVFVSQSNSIAPRQYGSLEVIFFPIVALLGFITRLLNDSIVQKHFNDRKKKQPIMNSQE